MTIMTRAGHSITRRIRHRLQASTFGRNVAVLAGGAAVGQLVAVALTPVLTRLYTPAQFGVYEIWVGLVGLVVVLSTLRYPEAVPLTSTDIEASWAVGAAIYSSAIVFIVSLLGVGLGGGWIADATGLPELRTLLWLLPAASLLHGLNFTMQGWATRKADFSGLAQTKVRQSLTGVLTQVLLGFTPLGLWGLAFGNAAGQGAGSSSLARRANRTGISWTAILDLQGVRRTAWRYRRFPMFRGPATIVNSIAVAAPPLTLAVAYNKEIAGLYALIVRLLGLPVAMIGESTMQVFYSEGSKLVREKTGSLTGLLRRTARGLALLSVPGLALAAALAPLVIPLILGSEWNDSARFLQLLVPMYIMRFVVTPVTGTFSILELQRLELGIEVFKTSLIVGAIALAGRLDWSPNVAVALISATGVIGFGTSFTLANRATGRFDRGELALARDRTTHLG